MNRRQRKKAEKKKLGDYSIVAFPLDGIYFGGGAVKTVIVVCSCGLGRRLGTTCDCQEAKR